MHGPWIYIATSSVQKGKRRIITLEMEPAQPRALVLLQKGAAQHISHNDWLLSARSVWSGQLSIAFQYPPRFVRICTVQDPREPTIIAAESWCGDAPSMSLCWIDRLLTGGRRRRMISLMIEAGISWQRDCAAACVAMIACLRRSPARADRQWKPAGCSPQCGSLNILPVRQCVRVYPWMNIRSSSARSSSCQEDD
jgi:hypothetical protein